MFDRYLIKNFDIDVLYFDENTRAFEKSLWGVSSLHYEPNYFKKCNNQLNTIIKNNSLLSYNENRIIRKEKRRRLLSIINSKNDDWLLF